MDFGCCSDEAVVEIVFPSLQIQMPGAGPPSGLDLAHCDKVKTTILK